MNYNSWIVITFLEGIVRDFDAVALRNIVEFLAQKRKDATNTIFIE